MPQNPGSPVLLPADPTAPSPCGVAPDTRGGNFFDDDTALRHLLGLYTEPSLLRHLTPHLQRLGRLAANELDELARVADQNPPVLHHRDRDGRDRQRIEYHPSYRELERWGLGELGLAALSHRGGVLGWPEPLPHTAKYALTYLFTQAEFGLCCPISMTDATSRVLMRFSDPDLRERYLPGLLSTDPKKWLQGAMFMTEMGSGSDVGATAAEARREGGAWRLYGEKWFCSNADADVVLLLARPQGHGGGTRGLGLFLMPRLLSTGEPNHYRIVRLKDKLGSRSMPTGEVVLEGAMAYPVGDLQAGFRQMAEMMNVSRLSNGVRAAGLMRRALRDALWVAAHRRAFGKPLVEHPVLRRQLLKIMLPTEEALSFVFFTAQALEQADGGDPVGGRLVRLLTPLLKFRACRDARAVCGDAMEVRGGCGYIEEWVNPRLVRDAHLGSIWEGTSNVVALDAIRRAVGREGCHRTWRETLERRLTAAPALPDSFRRRLSDLLDRAAALAERVASEENETAARQAATVLYHATCAVLLAWEGATLAESQGDGRRLLLARLVCHHRLTPRDPLSLGAPDLDERLTADLLATVPVARDRALELVAAP